MTVDACTTADTCAAGTCVGGAPPDCDDANVCTDDSCDPASGCFFTNNDTPCNDNIFCNGSDTCHEGICSLHTGNPCNDDGLYCNGEEYCDEVNAICLSSGNPCALLCDEDDDECYSPQTTTTTSVLSTTTIPLQNNVVAVFPPSETVSSEEILEFTAVTKINGTEIESTYSWEIVSASTIESSIDQETGRFSAGNNYTSTQVTDIVKVTDIIYDLTSTAEVITC